MNLQNILSKKKCNRSIKEDILKNRHMLSFLFTAIDCQERVDFYFNNNDDSRCLPVTKGPRFTLIIRCQGYVVV